jgi:hypothetical protein
LGAASPQARDGFDSDLRAALQIASTANTSKTEDGRSKIFGKWTAFCHSIGKCSDLSDVPGREHKLAYLIVFGMRYRNEGQKDKSVTSGTVKDALLAVGQGISNMGQPDPQKEVPGGLRNHPLLQSFFKGMSNKDDPAKRSYPANITVVRELFTVLDTADPIEGQANRHVINLTIITH